MFRSAWLPAYPRWSNKSHTPWPSFWPRVSKWVCGRQGGRGTCPRGPALLCSKLPDGACLWLHGGEAWHQHAAPVAPIDTTGAGDAFTGALAVALLEGRSPQEAARFAVAATELAVTAYGSQPGYALRERFEAQLAIERELTPWGR